MGTADFGSILRIIGTSSAHQTTSLRAAHISWSFRYMPDLPVPWRRAEQS